MARLVLLLSLLLGGCDRLGEIVLVPEYELLDSFESGLGSWSLRSADLGVPPAGWSVEATAATASDGVRALSFHVDNAGGAAKVWIVRPVDLAPGQDYDVAVGFDLGTPDTPGTAPWTLIAGAYPQEPEGAAGITFRDGTTPDSLGTGAVTWVEKSYELTVRASPDGKAVVVLGVWGRTAEERTYYLDNVRVFFTRR